MIYYAAETVDAMRQSQSLVIFGAGLVAYEVACCLKGEPYKLKIDCFLVSSHEGNPLEILGIPVVSLEEAEFKVGKEAWIIVAVMGKHMPSICETLHCYGYPRILPLAFESDLWSLIQGNYYGTLREKSGKVYKMLEKELPKELPANPEGDANWSADRTSIRVYSARCHVDRELKENLSRYDWEIPVQVGAALTEKQICEIRDDQGEHISYKNGQYCELTALYWIWKNDRSDYAGLCHYRRHFEVNRKILERLARSDIDVVLTIPILNFPSVGDVYRYDHSGEDWDVMMQAVHVLEPDYEETALKLQNGNFYYGYNMLIARKKILDAYCEWLFPILQYCEKYCGKKDGGYQGRYIGFLAERLMGIYFLHHEKEYKIVHVRKHFAE
ncbi:MAG: DUF4422 domain-containing protein [Lachnospiraceae bacterium]|jgi:predicted SprT family Zn-dependent metalloprotease|nr:DUF4422 domain-containing protein [Lachnospiraceae bacterium]NBJ80615.1 DUF4422 domain-containing protein [bacterium 1XD42-76]NBK03824.1 DUF4422 domain-containing protein [bacterium 1XD42-94]